MPRFHAADGFLAATFVVQPGARHYPWLNDVRWFVSIATDFLAEIGSTWLTPSVQRTGCNTESKLLMLGHAFDTWGVLRVTLKTDSRNARSRRAIERIGGRFEGIRRAHTRAVDGSVRDTAYYSIVAAEWPAVRAALAARMSELPPHASRLLVGQPQAGIIGRHTRVRRPHGTAIAHRSGNVTPRYGVKRCTAMPVTPGNCRVVLRRRAAGSVTAVRWAPAVVHSAMLSTRVPSTLTWKCAAIRPASSEESR